MNELPKGWVTANVGELLEFKYGKSLTEKSRAGGDYPVYGSNGVVGAHNEPLTNAPAIVIGRKGSIGEVHFTERPCFPIDTTYYVDRFDCVDAHFAKYLLKSLPLREMNRATAIPGLNREDAYSLDAAIPPLPEQRRIVAKIDSLTAKSARGCDHLDHIPRLVEKYKQAVLAAALRSNFTQVTPPYVSLGNICELRSGFAFSSSDFRPQGAVPVIRIGDINDGAVTFSENSRYLPNEFLASARQFIVERGDILVALSGATTGKSGMYNLEQPALLNQRVARLRVANEEDRILITYFLRSIADEILNSSYGGAQPNISPRKLAAFQMFWPNSDERRRLSQKIVSAMSWIDRLAQERTSARKLVDHFDQAVLAKAFRGELVPQDPNDEPASVLLERIKAKEADAAPVRHSRRQASNSNR